MTAEEVRAWWQANRLINSSQQEVKSPCFDCSRSFAEAMRAVGQCNGLYPGEIVGPVGALVKLANGYWGYSNPEDRLAARRATWRRARRSSTTATA